MYDSRATFRPELTSFLEEATGRDKHLIGHKLLPVFPVKERKGIFPKVDIANSKLFRRIDKVTRAPHTPYPEYERTFKDQTFETYDSGGVVKLDATEMNDLARFNLHTEPQETEWLGKADMRGHEVDVAEKLQDAGNFPADHSHDAAIEYKIENKDTLDIVTDMDQIIDTFDSIGIDASELCVVIPKPVWQRAVKRSKLLMEYAFGHTGADATTKERIITPTSFAKLFDFKEVFIARSHVDVSKKKGTIDLQPCWNPDHIFVGVIGGGDFKNPKGGVGRTLVWEREVPQNGRDPHSPEGGGGRMQVVETWRKDETRTLNIRVRSHRNPYIVDALKGYVLNTGYSAT